MDRKVLFTSHTSNFSKFNRPFMRWFQEQGFEVHYASAGEEEVFDCDKHFIIPFQRSPYSTRNICAYHMLKQLIDNEQYALIHCHTPVGGVITRLAAQGARKNGTKLLYTAHGFHFFKGAPIQNWLIYYPIEKFCARMTDVLITINQEDYSTACRKHFNAKKIIFLNGVGVDLTRFFSVTQQEKLNLRERYGYRKDDFILLNVAELNDNKNQEFLLRAVSKLKEKISGIKMLFAGAGVNLERYKQLTKELCIDGQVEFLGYRKDVDALYQLSDVCVSASRREGLPVNIIEGMASGLPVVCTKIRGHVDLIQDQINGYLYSCNDEQTFRDRIYSLYQNDAANAKFAQQNIITAHTYSLTSVLERMADVYQDVLENTTNV